METAQDIKEKGASQGVQKCVRFRCPSEVMRIANELSTYCDDPLSACTAISELLLNAIEHGNLGIGGQLKAELLREDRLQDEIERRLTALPWGARRATVEFIVNHTEIVMSVSDEGEGFDWRALPQELDFTALNGRGILLARSLYFEDIRYNEAGTACTARKAL